MIIKNYILYLYVYNIYISKKVGEYVMYEIELYLY